jgi:hypothetical protein
MLVLSVGRPAHFALVRIELRSASAFLAHET